MKTGSMKGGTGRGRRNAALLRSGAREHHTIGVGLARRYSFFMQNVTSGWQLPMW